MPEKFILALAALLVLAALPLPSYSLYVIVRLAAFAGFAWCSWTAAQRKRSGLAIACAVLAVLFNPVAPLHAGKLVWAAADLGSALFLVLCRKRLSLEAEE